jgi:hypothetical protein
VFELLAVAALVVLALAAFVSLFRRGRGNRTPAAREAAPPRAAAAPPVAQPAVPAPAAPPEVAPLAAAAEPTRASVTPIQAQPFAPSRAARATTPGALPSAGASVDLPAKMPESFEERDALLKRMADAPPDKANPFTARSRRIKRARLILQSLGQTFADRDPRIDLSQYPNNWPELARRKYSQAA